MTISKFEDMIAWQKAQQLCVLLYIAMRDSKDYNFRDQLLRAVISISNNIAEGFDRGTQKELRQFLYIAKGSAAEVKSMLFLAQKLGTMQEKTLLEAFTLVDETSKILAVFIKRINTSLTVKQN